MSTELSKTTVMTRSVQGGKETPENNTELDSFISAVVELHGPARRPKATRSKFYLSSFMPRTTTDFYLYSGSITFPPCTERVMTVVFESSVDIGKQQLDKMRLLKTRLGSENCQGLIAGNIRKLSEKQDASKTVYRSFRFMPSQAGGHKLRVSTTPMLITAALLWTCLPGVCEDWW
ncbi:hypothetical protein ISCGN_008616 [Ixodes scapularis]